MRSVQCRNEISSSKGFCVSRFVSSVKINRDQQIYLELSRDQYQVG